ncbi:MAG: hypothetical protein ACD_20C00419G0004 [uncultured bacterium]|nr:MAG: hypothetical protein ACD_20C00419G0004 [uncultured bacterium]HBH18384.1 hypothetical protein [Cyanobacteria bacterium UBA9579]
MVASSIPAIALMDCDSFFASCEQLFNPALLNQPVCVMSSNNGCIVARSREAKELGVKMGMPVFQAKRLFPDVHYIAAKHDLYGEISARVMRVLSEFSPIIEIYSIDEAFIDLTGLEKTYKKSYLEIASDIRNAIKYKVGVPVSIGVSSTKVLAKLATRKAKKSHGIYKIDYQDIDNELMQTDLIDIWGMGNNTVTLLNQFGLHTAYEFVCQSENFINRTLGKKGMELKLELTGKSIYRISHEVSLPKSIQQTSSFGKFTSNEQYIKDSLYYHAHRACTKLRRLGQKTQTIGIMLRTKDFKVYSTKIALVYSTNWEFEIFESINKNFNDIFNPQVIYRSSGVILENLSEEYDSQLSLFDTLDIQIKQQNLAKAWDKLEAKYGNNVILIGDRNIKHC